MGRQESNIGIDSLKNRIVNISLVVGGLMYATAFALSFSDVPNYFNKLNYIVNTFTLSLAISVAIFRKRLSLKIKSSILIFALITVVILHVAWLGIYSEYLPLIIMVPFFSTMAFSLKHSVIIFLSTIAAIVLLGLLHVSGYLSVRDIDLERYSHIQTWILALLILGFVSISILIILTQFNTSFFRLLQDLKQKNRSLTFSEQSYREIFNSSTDAIFKMDYQGNIEDVNDAMLEMYGYIREEIQFIEWKELNKNKEGYGYEEVKKYFTEVIEHGSTVFEWLSTKRNGETFWIEVSMKKARILGQNKLLAVVRDIDEKKKIQIQLDNYRNRLEDLVQERTVALHRANDELTRINGDLIYQKEELRTTLEELKSAHEKLLRSEKMATLGVLSAGIAHEVNSPLQYIQAGSLGLEAYFEDNYNDIPEEINILLNSINEGVSRSADIVASLNQFSRQKNEKTEHFNIHTIIDNCLNILSNKIKHRIEIERQFYYEPIIISGNEGQLHQVIINILNNAAQAITKEGKIIIKTLVDNDNVQLVFIDSGKGISPEDINRLTEPFFTTKPSGEGTGLGLSITQKIIEEHNGQLLFESELGMGTTVRISLPL
ncbi:ATP-binding protein [Carboxylicivirga caseinilyticus]|uniref:sensor histidine kinase n=1 Tax=Carboxylicivirga caseinilyticus TaxID=3417572 RepID=UPI003D32EBCB|nr:PAS domain S-box protein [Marinilabiliaceae bacterium A049]